VDAIHNPVFQESGSGAGTAFEQHVVKLEAEQRREQIPGPDAAGGISGKGEKDRGGAVQPLTGLQRQPIAHAQDHPRGPCGKDPLLRPGVVEHWIHDHPDRIPPAGHAATGQLRIVEGQRAPSDEHRVGPVAHPVHPAQGGL